MSSINNVTPYSLIPTGRRPEWLTSGSGTMPGKKDVGSDLGSALIRCVIHRFSTWPDTLLLSHTAAMCPWLQFHSKKVIIALGTSLMNIENAVALLITHFISMEKCDSRGGRGGKAACSGAGWTLSEQCCWVPAYLRHYVGVFLCLPNYSVHIYRTIPVFMPLCVCRPVTLEGLQKDKLNKLKSLRWRKVWIN